jgi:hypothetical protein
VVNRVGSICPAATLATLFAGSKGIHQVGRDGDALDPQRLQVQRRRPATWTDQLGALLEGLRDANRLRGHAGAQPVGQPVDLGTGLLGGWSPSWRRTSGQSRRQASGRSPRSPKASTAASQDHGQPDRVGFTTPNGADFDVQGHRTFPLLPVLLACKAAPRTVKVVIQPLLVSMGTHRVRHNCLWWAAMMPSSRQGPDQADMALAGNCGSFPTRGGPARRSR